MRPSVVARRSFVLAVSTLVVILSLSKGGYAAETPAAATPPAEMMRVQVIGSVPKPGWVTLPAGSRLSDALAAAGLRPRTTGETLPGTTLAEIADCWRNPADLHRIYLGRAAGAQRTIYQIAVTQDPKDQRYDPLMRDDDKIFVASACRPPFKVISSER